MSGQEDQICRWFIEAVSEKKGAFCVAEVNIPDLKRSLSFGMELPENVSLMIETIRENSRWGRDIQGCWDYSELKTRLERRDNLWKDRGKDGVNVLDTIGIVVSMMEGLSKRFSGHSFRIIGWAVTPTPTK